MTFALAILIAQLGASVALLGWFGRRVEATPRCRRCEYDLRGIDAPTRCPECGASLDGPRAVRRDAVQRRPRWIAIGVAMLLLGGTTIGLDRGGLLTAQTLDRITPTAWLLWRVDHDRGTLLDASVDRLLSRLAREPNRFSELQRRRTLETLVMFQGDPALSWKDAWGWPIDRAYAAGDLPPALLARYLGNAVDSIGVTLDRTTIAPGDLIRPAYRVSGTRLPDPNREPLTGDARLPFWAVDCRFVMRFGNVVISNQRASETPDGFVLPFPSGSQPNWGYVPRMPRDILEKVAPGPQVLGIELTLDVQDTSRRSRGTLHQAVRSIRIPVTLRSATTEPIE